MANDKLDVRSPQLPEIPKENDGWVETPWYKELEFWAEKKFNTLLVGQAGSGKTSGAYHLAARTKSRFLRYSFENVTNMRQIFGQYQIIVENGSPRTVFFESQLIALCRSREKGIILLDEVNMLDPQKAATLHELLDNRMVFIKEADGGHGEVLHIPETVVFVLACNPPRGAYIGTQRMNAALVDRCVTIIVPGLPKAHLTKILKNMGGLKEEDLAGIVKLYLEMDKLIMNQGLRVQTSVRALMRMREAVLEGDTLGNAACKGLVRHAEAVGDIAGAQALRSLLMTVLPAAQQPSKEESVGIPREDADEG